MKHSKSYPGLPAKSVFIALLIISIFIVRPVYCQISSILELEETVKDALGKHELVATKTKSSSLRYSGEGNTLLLDSMYESDNNLGQMQYIHWYYYNNNNLPDSVAGIYYNYNKELSGQTEARKYDAHGNLLKLVISQKGYSYDPSIQSISIKSYDAKVEEMEYRDNKLISKKVTTVMSFLSNLVYVDEHVYLYDEYGKLLADSIIPISSGTTNTTATHYIYDKDDNLTFEYYLTYKEGLTYIGYLKKYSHERTDSTYHLNIKKSKDMNSIYTDTSDFSKIKYFYSNVSYLETYNDKNQLITYTTSNNYNSHYKCIEDYRLEYTYTDNGSFDQIKGYLWNEKDTLNQWREFLHINYEYDEESNVLKYNKMVYDSQLNKWVINNRKEYYYSRLDKGKTSSLNENTTKDFQLYPNPANDFLHIKNPNKCKSNYSIYNMVGSVVAKGQLDGGNINVSNFEPGLYLITIENETENFMGKFMKQ